MHDRPLPALISQLWMVAPVEDKEHDRPRAEVERHVFADHRAGVAIDAYLLETALLDLRHTHYLALQIQLDSFGI